MAVTKNAAATLQLDRDGIYSKAPSSISGLVNQMTTSEAASAILNFMTLQKGNTPFPNSQSFCFVATAISHTTTPKHNQDITSISRQHDSKEQALELFRSSRINDIPPDGRFVNAILRCFGNDITGAVEAWKKEIGGVVRRYQREQEQQQKSSEHWNKKRRKNNQVRSSNRSGSSLEAAYHALFTISGRAGRPDIALRLTYAMAKETLEPNETALFCYQAGKRQRLPGIKSIMGENQFESLLTVECSKYDKDDQRRVGEAKVRIIM